VADRNLGEPSIEDVESVLVRDGAPAPDVLRADHIVGQQSKVGSNRRYSLVTDAGTKTITSKRDDSHRPRTASQTSRMPLSPVIDDFNAFLASKKGYRRQTLHSVVTASSSALELYNSRRRQVAELEIETSQNVAVKKDEAQQNEDAYGVLRLAAVQSAERRVAPHETRQDSVTSSKKRPANIDTHRQDVAPHAEQIVPNSLRSPRRYTVAYTPKATPTRTKAERSQFSSYRRDAHEDNSRTPKASQSLSRLDLERTNDPREHVPSFLRLDTAQMPRESFSASYPVPSQTAVCTFSTFK
jgi:hypothetical protein